MAADDILWLRIIDDGRQGAQETELGVERCREAAQKSARSTGVGCCDLDEQRWMRVMIGKEARRGR